VNWRLVLTALAAAVLLPGGALLPGAALLPEPAQAQEPASADSLTLRDAVRLALAVQPRVAGAVAALDAARAGRAEAVAAWWPQVALDAGVTRFEKPMLVTPLHGFDPNFLMNPPEFDETIVDATLSARWTMFEGGERRARVRAATARARAAESALEGAEDATITITVMAYADAVAARETLIAHDQRLEALATERSRVEKALAEGAAAGVDLARADAALAQARADRVAAAADLEVAAGELARLIGLPDAGPALAARLALPTIEPPAPPAAAESPAVVRARWEVEAAEAAADAARAAWWPDVATQGAYIERGAAGEPDTYSGEWQAALRLDWAVFTGGARKAQVERAEAEERQAEQRLRQAEIDQADEVERGRAAFERARAREIALAEAVEASAEVARVERLELDVGAGVQADWIDAQADLLEARAGLIEARAGSLVAAVELARATGTLDLAWLESHLGEEVPR
jgi:outer membrane protein TolC